MPKDAFFKLPIEKQQELLDAAKKEFSEHLLSEASINQIIKEIKMPRGTFYLYFDNKYELYNHIVKNYMEHIDIKIKELLHIYQGDIILTFIDLYDYLVDTCLPKYRKLIKNIFLNMNYNLENAVLPKHNKNCIHHKFATMMELIDIHKLNIQENDDIIDILYILKSMMFHSISRTFLVEDTDVSFIRTRYINQLMLIRNGIYRKEEN